MAVDVRDLHAGVQDVDLLPGGHRLGGRPGAEAQGALHQAGGLLLGGVVLFPFVLEGLQRVAQVVLGDVGFGLLAGDHRRDALADPGKQRRQRGQKLHQQIERLAVPQAILLAVGLGPILRQHLREHEDQQRGDQRGGGENQIQMPAPAEQPAGQQGCNRRTGDMQNVDADEHGCERAVVVIEDVHDVLGAAVAVLRVGFHAELVDTGQRRLADCEIGCPDDQQNDQNDIGSHAAHLNLCRACAHFRSDSCDQLSPRTSIVHGRTNSFVVDNFQIL